MGVENKRIGLRGHARSPGSISNMEHHDPSGAHRGIDGTPAQIEAIFGDAVEHAIADDSILRVVNLSGGTAYLWIGAAGSAPGAPAVGDSFALPDGHFEIFYAGRFDAKISVAFKSSSALVQVSVIKARS